MKKLLALMLTVICIAALASCASAVEENPYFTGRVIEKFENRCLLEVTNTGNRNFFVGETLIVNTNIENCPDYEVGDHLTIVFDGKVALSYPGQILNVYRITKTDSNGNDLQ